MPVSLERLGQALPSAIMAVLIVYCMKDIPSGGLSAALPKLLAAAVVFITYKWKHQTLISILLGTISYMVLLHLF
jgi:branched-subunit amino acid transport protein AzlD